MDGTAWGTLLLGVGAVATAVVTYLGKRGEHQLSRQAGDSTRALAVLDQVQEERDGLRVQVQQRDARIAELVQQHGEDLVQLARLRVRLIELGGEESDP